MVRIEENKLVIEIEGDSPGYILNGFKMALIGVLKATTEHMENDRDAAQKYATNAYYVLELLDELNDEGKY